MIKIYGRDNCSFCQQAVQLATNRKYDFEYFKIGKDLSKEEFSEMFPMARTVPQIVIEENLIGGFTDFENWSLGKELGGMTL